MNLRAAERLFNATSRQAAIAELRSILYGEIKIDPAKLEVRGPSDSDPW